MPRMSMTKTSRATVARNDGLIDARLAWCWFADIVPHFVRRSSRWLCSTSQQTPQPRPAIGQAANKRAAATARELIEVALRRCLLQGKTVGRVNVYGAGQVRQG